MDSQQQTRYFTDPEVKKCSRCRVKRVDESPELLNKYATCSSCRAKRKVVKTPVDISNVPNTFSNYDEFVDKIKTNVSDDVFDHHYRGETDPLVIRRYDTDIDSITYQQVAKQLIEIYINPLMVETGYRFPVRDYHKGGGKSKKISFMFICSQDRGRQRKSRSTDQRAVPNKLKTQLCHSKIGLNYSLADGSIAIHYNHKAHPPYSWKRPRDDDEQDDRLESIAGSNRSNGGHYLTEQFQEQTRQALQTPRQQYNPLPSQAQLQLPSINQRYNLLENNSNGYNNSQLQNLSTFNQQQSLHFGQFHIPLTQYQAQTNPPITTTTSNGSNPALNASANAAIEQALANGLPLPQTTSTSASSLMTYTTSQDQTSKNGQVNETLPRSLEQPAQARQNLQHTISYPVNLGTEGAVLEDHDVMELNNNEKKSLNTENIDKELLKLETGGEN